MDKKKDDTKDVVEIFRATKKESETIKEFAMLSRESKSDFIRGAIAMRIQGIRDNLGLREPEDDGFYEDFYENDDEDEEENW